MTQPALPCVALAGLGLLAGLVAQLPAARAVDWMVPVPVEAAGVHGTAWRGGAQYLQVGGQPPASAVEWDIAILRLLTGELLAETTFDIAGGRFSGRLGSTPGGDLRIRDGHFSGDAAGIGQALNLPVPVTLEGSVLARIPGGRLAAGRPRDVEARLLWDAAAIRSPVDLALGRVSLDVTPNGDAHRFTLVAREGALIVDGQGSLDAEGMYTVALRIRPTAEAPADIVDILSMFAERSGADFVVRHGGRLHD